MRMEIFRRVGRRTTRRVWGLPNSSAGSEAGLTGNGHKLLLLDPTTACTLVTTAGIVHSFRIRHYPYLEEFAQCSLDLLQAARH